ncbi:unnamed protein product [Prunus armeniaca]
MAHKKKIQNLLTWCLFSVEGNDEAILSWSFYGLANNKVSWPCDFEFTSKFMCERVLNFLNFFVVWTILFFLLMDTHFKCIWRDEMLNDLCDAFNDLGDEE